MFIVTRILKTFAVVMLFIFVFGVTYTLAQLSKIARAEGVVYDCRLSEISPDFPPEVRNECRKLKAKKIQHI
jgi:hypothetical protein